MKIYWGAFKTLHWESSVNVCLKKNAKQTIWLHIKECAFVNNLWKNVHLKLIYSIENVKYLRWGKLFHLTKLSWLMHIIYCNTAYDKRDAPQPIDLYVTRYLNVSIHYQRVLQLVKKRVKTCLNSKSSEMHINTRAYSFKKIICMKKIK